MYMCVCVCVWVGLCVRVCTYIYVYIYTHIYMADCLRCRVSQEQHDACIRIRMFKSVMSSV